MNQELTQLLEQEEVVSVTNHPVFMLGKSSCL